MLRIANIKSSSCLYENELKEIAARKIKVSPEDIPELEIVRRSLDARNKNDIHYVYTIDVRLSSEEKIFRRNRGSRNISIAEKNKYTFPDAGNQPLSVRPVIVGSGPAGLFCAYMLASYGYRPILIEQGEPVDDRKISVERFWEGTAPLKQFSNVQYGEGGAGTFSDGKLNSSVHDRDGRNHLVLKIFADHGAKAEILYDAKPHIGTDCLREIVKNIRNEIISNGGEVLFNTRLAGVNTIDGILENITIENVSADYADKDPEERFRHLPANLLVAAIGHSSVETFKMLKNAGVKMEAKAFAVGVRAEHLQKKINEVQYGFAFNEKFPDLPPADYKLVYHAADGRSVYSFCMCPGGYVVNSSSEEGQLCINGMSYSGRDGVNANSAIIVSITPEDTGADKDVLAGFDFQKKLEQAAWKAGCGHIPVQSLGDFKDKAGKAQDKNYAQNNFAHISARHKGSDSETDLSRILPDFLCRDIVEAFESFGQKIKGFDDPDTLLSAVESRTSSPVRIVRDDKYESNISGIFPCGEGAGYAGGIMSAAIDGIRIAEEIRRRYAPFD